MQHIRSDDHDAALRRKEELRKKIEDERQLIAVIKEALYDLERANIYETAPLTRRKHTNDIKQQQAEEATRQSNITKWETELRCLDRTPLHRALTLIDHSKQESHFVTGCEAAGSAFVLAHIGSRSLAAILFIERLLRSRLPTASDEFLECRLHIGTDLPLVGANPWRQRLVDALDLKQDDNLTLKKTLNRHLLDRPVVLIASHDDLGDQLGPKLLEFWHHLLIELGLGTLGLEHCLHLFYLHDYLEPNLAWPPGTIKLTELGASYTRKDLEQWFSYSLDDLPQGFRKLTNQQFIKKFFVPNERNLDRVIERILNEAGQSWGTVLPSSSLAYFFYQDWDSS